MAENASRPTALQNTWNGVVNEINQSGAVTSAFTPHQRAFLNLARPLALVEGVAVLAVPNQYVKDFIETELSGTICQELSAKLGRSYTLAITVDVDADNHQVQPPLPPQTQTEPQAQPQSQPQQPQSQAQQQSELPPAEPQLVDPLSTTPATAPTLLSDTSSLAEPAPLEPHPLDPLDPHRSTTNHPYQVQHSSLTPPDFSHRLATDPRMAAIDPRMAQQPGHAPLNAETGWQTSHARPTQNPVEQQPMLRSREQPAHNPNKQNSLNARYTFDTYVVSDSNKLPTSAAIAVAEKPARAYNPLFVWGGSGLGKTHLMHAIGNYALELNPKLRIKYVSSEEFTNDYINSVRDDRQESFKRRYRELDILMVDDIQFLQGKEGTQEEFFHTFNALQQTGKQIVLSSDRPPTQLTTLEDRLRTRFQSGLIADIYPPDLETRIAILMKKAEADGIAVSREVLELIASRFNSSIRELEGAFIRVSAYSSLNNTPITPATADIALRDIMPEEPNVEVTADVIMLVTAEFFEITTDQIISTSKARPIAHARQLAMYLCRELTELSLPKIGELFGGKDHTTVMYATRKIHKEITEKRDTYDQIQRITSRIKNYNRP